MLQPQQHSRSSCWQQQQQQHQKSTCSLCCLLWGVVCFDTSEKWCDDVFERIRGRVAADTAQPTAAPFSQQLQRFSTVKTLIETPQKHFASLK
jgi:hypothetical protein